MSEAHRRRTLSLGLSRGEPIRHVA